MIKKYVFSAPGRTEICGNHTDHQHGCVLAAAVDLETIAEVTLNQKNHILIQSDGYPAFTISIDDLEIHENEMNTTAALVRGIVAAFVQRGSHIQGFDAVIHSTVLPGSGLSSSAAFEVLIGTICNSLFFESKLSPIEIAQIGQWAENVYFGKPCGLMDQMASSVGGLISIDFADPSDPVVEKIDFDFSKTGYTLCIIDSGADHADLTDEYAAITTELRELCACFRKNYLRQVPETEFLSRLPEIRGKVSDRSILRAMHVYQENKRVLAQKNALKQNDFESFLKLCKESGYSSWMYMQNVSPTGAINNQAVGFALALCDTLLQGRGAYRVHGGGFAGTIQAFVPNDMLEQFQTIIERNLGKDTCHILNIRPQGGIQLQ